MEVSGAENGEKDMGMFGAMLLKKGQPDCKSLMGELISNISNRMYPVAGVRDFPLYA